LRILLLGPEGQVGWELQRALATAGEVIPANRAPDAALPADLEHIEKLRAAVRGVAPDIIVNAAAYTAVDKAESEAERAQLVNATAPGVLAEEAARSNAWLIHYSTDYVFDGSGTLPWRETDSTSPLNVYGRTKLEGEDLIRASGCRHLILRTSWVYANRGTNFLRTMIRLAGERDRLTVVDDQYGAPTGAELIADATAQSIRGATRDPALSGTYHLTASGETTWYSYARFAMEVARRLKSPIRVADEAIVPCRSDDFPSAARRPQNSRLSTAKLRSVFGLELPDWRVGVERTVREICNS
jgi:dTDP-4-dehydrorhamnose reductase